MLNDFYSYVEYEKTGKYPDGTMLVKEFVSVGSKEASSGAGDFREEFIGLETVLKDSKRFSNDPGSWGYYSFDRSYPLKDAAKADRADECNRYDRANVINGGFSQNHPVLCAASSNNE